MTPKLKILENFSSNVVFPPSWLLGVLFESVAWLSLEEQPLLLRAKGTLKGEQRQVQLLSVAASLELILGRQENLGCNPPT